MSPLAVAPLEERRSLPWGSALRIAWRELLISRVKFLFVILSVAIGVAALTGVRGFSESFATVLLGQARSILAGDLSARMSRTLRPEEQAKLAAYAKGVDAEMTQVTEMASMAGAQGDPVPLLVALKVIDPRVYPYYGSVTLAPAMPLTQAVTDRSVAVDDNLLVRLKVHVGDNLRIGGRLFRIAAVVQKEPDRLTAGVGIGPRVMMTRQAVEETGLLQAGSRATERFLFKLPFGSSIVTDRHALEQTLPEAQVADYREGSPAISDGLNQATGLLSLICLVAMVLGAIGVAMAMRAHLGQRIDSIAIMKSLGARSSDVLRIYALQTLLLGAMGAAVGVLGGLAVEWTLPSVLGSLLPLRPPVRLPWVSVSGAFATGVLTTMLFTLPPLLQVRTVRPSVVLRRLVEIPEEQNALRTLMGRLRREWVQGVCVVGILLALAAIASVLSNSWKGGSWFAAALAGSLLVLLGLSAGVLRLLRAVLDRSRASLPSTLRHGLANLYRPGNQTAAVLAALGVGVMLILSVFLMQRSIVARMHEAMAPGTPNMFLIDISPAELEGVRATVLAQPGVEHNFEALPVLTGHIEALDGVPVSEIHTDENGQRHGRRRLQRTASLTWSSKLPPGVQVEQGKWWTSDDAHELAVVDTLARRFHLHLGQNITFAVGATKFTARVTAIYKPDGQHISARSEFIGTPGELKGTSPIWYAAAHAQPAAIAGLQQALFARYPTVTVINIADILDTIQHVVGQITIVIRFLAGFSILSGAVILASSVASTRFRRVREVVVLKTLGATRARIAGIFSVEFAVMGLLAGVVGAVFASALARVLLHLAEVPYVPDSPAQILGVVLTATLAIVTGWIASFRILGQKPLEVLREE